MGDLYTFDIHTYLHDLGTLVNLDSGTWDMDDITKATRFFSQLCTEFHVNKKKLSNKIAPVLEITYGNPPFDLLLVCHIDTVFPHGTAKKRPFSLIQDKAIGPGVADMKSGLLLALYVLRAIYTHRIPLSVCLMVSTAEEIESIHTRNWVHTLGTQSNHIFVFEPSRFDAGMIIQRKNYHLFETHLHGKASHAGIAPHKGISAVVELAHWITALHTLNYGGCSLNIAPISGGYATNVVPSNAYMKFEMRSFDDTDTKLMTALLTKLQNHASATQIRSEVTLISKTHALTPNEYTNKMLKIIQAIEPISVKSVGGVSDANTLYDLPVPILDGMGPCGDYFHTDKEYISIPSIEPRFHLLMKIMQYIAQHKS